MVMMAVLLTGLEARTQDTLRITLQAAEQQFLDHNLALLANRYQLHIARAEMIQARLYNNPTFSYSGNLYNPELKKAFDVSNKTGQYDIQLQQLVTLAGKRHKQISLAATNVLIAEFNFYDLLRTLRYSLRSTYFSLQHLQRSREAYLHQIASLQQLSNAYSSLQARGMVSLKDAVRIKSLLYALQAEETSLQNRMNELQGELQLLLQDNRHYYLPETINEVMASPNQYALQALVDSAYNNRYDLKVTHAQTLYHQQNLALQKAMRTPDLTLGLEFDKRGSHVNDATFLNVAMDLPFFNRNQGNIKAAQSKVAQGKVLHQQQQLTVENEVQQAYRSALNSERMLQSLDPAFQQQYDQLLLGITENFQKKNISLLEFTDFYESWRSHVLQWNQLRNEKDQAMEALNFAIGKTLFN